MTLLIIYVAIALGVSFLCSILEASLLTITPTQIEAGKNDNQRWAQVYGEMKADVDRPLAAILTLNTVAHTMGAAGAGAQYARVFGYGSEALFAVALTAAVLILTEIIPKTIGARYAVGVAPFVARVLPVLVVGLAPLVWFSQQLTRVITRGRPAPLPKHRDELLTVARMGEDSGQLLPGESRVLRNVLQLDAVKAGDIMTPRTVVFALPQDTPLQEFVAAVEESPFTRIPVYEGDDRADITGFVLKSEALMRHIQTRDNPAPTTLADLARPLASTLDKMPVDRLFRHFISEGHHILLVVDEYGTAVGIVTLEDVVETVFGFEIVDELDTIPDLRVYARELWLKRAQRSGVKDAASQRY
ncbi:CNNM domain-containing protein [Luteimonas sp. A277]